MPTYRYHARDARGLAQAGSLAAASSEAAAAQLRGRGQLVLQVEEEAGGPAAPTARVTWNPLTWLPATSFDVEVGLQQLSPMLVSGLSLLSGLRNGDLTFMIVSDTFRARMQVLEQNNQVEALATPMLLTANNEVSRLLLGEERPLVRSISSQTILTDNTVATTPNTTVEFESVGNTLVITPNINSDRTVTLRLLQENSFINPAGASIPVVTGTSTNGTNVQNVPVDVVGTRSVSGTFVAKDGLAVVVGGLIENEKVDRRSQAPFLGRIPFLGALFRRQEKVAARRELVIMIRPRVISTPAEAEDISGTLPAALVKISNTSNADGLALLARLVPSEFDAAGTYTPETGTRIVAVGVGPNCKLVPTLMLNTPVYPGCDGTYYGRYLAFFKVFESGERAILVGTSDSYGRTNTYSQEQFIESLPNGARQG